MLHVGILPHHAAWGDLLSNLAFVVVDEAHVYRGVFGSHVANVLRRLRRAAALYGTDPPVPARLATIANPLELAQKLTGLDDINLIDNDSAPRPSRRTAIWNPPLLDTALGVRGSPLAEAAELLAELVSAGARTICFMKSRKGVELILRMACDRLPAELAERLAPYRARLHTRPAPRDRASAGRRRAARRRRDRRARARDRHRQARRRDLRDLPGHRRQPAADVGPRRAPRPRPGDLRRRRGRARPVLRAPPAGVPAPTGGGRDHRPGQRGDPRRASAVRRPRGADHRGRRGHARTRGRRQSTSPGRRGPAARARHRLRPCSRRRLPGRPGCSALGLSRQLRADRRRRRRADRDDRGRARLLDRPRGRDLPAHGSLLPRPRARSRRPPGAARARRPSTTSPRPSGRA